MSFLDKYTDFAAELTDAPEATHYRTAMSVMAACLNRKVYIRQGDDEIFPNLWILVIAQSGLNRKSTSMRIGAKLLSRVDQEYLMESDFSSRERFLECIGKRPRSIMFVSEFKSFMGMLSRDYMAGMQSVLTELFDNPNEYVKPRKGPDGDLKINAPCINMFCCTTSEWLINSIKDDDVAGGYLPRFLIFSAPQKEKSMALRPIVDENKKMDLVRQLSKINQIKGELKLSKEAVKYYTNWYLEFEKTVEGMPHNIISFYSRLTDYALKFSIIYCVDRCFETLKPHDLMDGDISIHGNEIAEEDVKNGCHLARSYGEDLKEFMEVEVSFNWREKVKKKMEKIIKAKYPHPISRAELMRETRVMSDDLTKFLKTLEEEEKIKIVEKEITNTGHRQGQRKSYLQQEIYWLNGAYNG